MFHHPILTFISRSLELAMYGEFAFFLLSSLRSSFVELAYPPEAIPSLRIPFRESPFRLSGFKTRNRLHCSDITSGWRKINIHRFMTA